MHWLALLLLVVSWLVPLHFPPWVSWHSELVAFAAVLLAGWIAVFGAARRTASSEFRVPLLGLSLLGLALLAMVQALTGLIVFGGDAFILVLYLALCLISLLLGFNGTGRTAPSAEVELTALAGAVLAGALLSALLGLAQVVEVWETMTWLNPNALEGRAGANLGQPNHLATLVVMGMASAVYLFESGKLGAVGTSVAFALLALGLAMAGSRGGVLSFLVLLCWWLLKCREAGFKLRPLTAVLASAACLILFWGWPSVLALIQLSDGSPGVNTSVGTRYIVWPQLMHAVSLRPWWGWGLNQVPKAHNAVLHEYAVSEPFSYSHNVLLDLALGVGLPLAALLLVACAVWAWRRVRRADRLNPWYCLALALPLAVHSFFEFPFAYAYFLAPVMFALGVLERELAAGAAPKIRSRTLAGMLLVVTAAGAWSAIEYASIEEDFRVARFESLHVGQTPADYHRPGVVLITQLGALLDVARLTPRAGMTADELALARNAALRYPWTATQNRYALSLALNGDPEGAIRQLLVMKAMHGPKAYASIRAAWQDLAQTRHPQLRDLQLP